MNKKFIIQIVVIIIAFGGAGLVLYNGLFKSSGTGTAPVAPAAAQQSILPYGTAMDFDAVLYQHNLQYNVVSYPVLNADSEVGIPVEKLITPIITAPAPAKK